MREKNSVYAHNCVRFMKKQFENWAVESEKFIYALNNRIY